MFKIIIAAVIITIVGLFVMSKIDPNNQISTVPDNTEVSTDKSGNVKVTITGNILHPGEYLVSPASTLGELILKAGGALAGTDKNAYTESLVIGNRSSFYIAAEAEIPDTCVVTDIEKININKATKDQLEAIGGLNNSQIEAILAYRKTDGLFYALEDIMKVSGIGEKTYLSVRDKITIA